MKLDNDCVRAVLLAVENASRGQLRLPFLCEQLPQYDEDTLNYTCLKLTEGGFLDSEIHSVPGETFPVLIWINSMTYQGHEFLDTIRDDTNWGKVKATAKKAGVFSMKALAEISQGVAQAAITAALQGHL